MSCFCSVPSEGPKAHTQREEAAFGSKITNQQPTMYKAKVNELCHKRSWSLPEYQTKREGPLHSPCFTSTITTNGLQLNSPEPTRIAKEARNNAVKLAFVHLSQSLGPNNAVVDTTVTATVTEGHKKGVDLGV